MATWLVRVRGSVQGVGYRYDCVKRARALGLAGWVRNRADGSVEALLQGPELALLEMREQMRQGPPAAVVRELDVEPQDGHPPVEGFQQLPTA